MFPTLARTSNVFRRQLMNNIVRNSHSEGGVPGENLPFSINNRYKLTLYFSLFIGSGLAVPYLVMRHQLTK